MRHRLLVAIALPVALKLLRTGERMLRARGNTQAASRVQRLHATLSRFRKQRGRR